MGFYYSRRRLFHRLTLTLALFAIFVVLAPFYREALIAALASGILLFGLDRRTLQAAQDLRVRVSYPLRASERQSLDVRVDLEGLPNADESGFAVRILCALRFDGSKVALQTQCANEKLTFSFPCTAGMGEFPVGPLTLLVSDPFGLFEYTLQLDADACGKPVTVYPRSEPIAPVPLRGSSDSLSYGIYAVQARGNSVNFIGVRPFSRGDSLRQISWRLSAKTGRLDELLVKDFERTVSSTVTLILDMDSHAHVGRQADSTWEYAKDAAIAMLKDQIEQGNPTQLISQELTIPFGSGEEHFQRLSRGVFGLQLASSASKEVRPANESQNTEAAPLDVVTQNAPWIPDHTSVIYIGPCFGDHYPQVETALLTLTQRGIEVVAVLIDSASFIGNTVQGDLKLFVDTQASLGRTLLENAVPRLNAKSIRTYVLSKDRSVGAGLMRPAR